MFESSATHPRSVDVHLGVLPSDKSYNYVVYILPGRFGVHVVARGGQVGKHVLDGLHVECPVSSALCHNVLAQDIYHTRVLHPE